MSAYFSGKTVLITGGSSGIGLAFARIAIAGGAKVTIAARREDVLGDARASLLAGQPGAQVSTMALDVADEAQVVEKLGELSKREPVDVLVNNAGVVLPGRFLELPSAEFRRMMDVNYFGAVHCCRAVLPSMVTRKRG